jgi:exopolysaccharide biosynthesis predicted pyruvyltransferase EpsI
MCDLLIINGEGTIHKYPRNTKWLPIVINNTSANVKIILINTLWQEMDELPHLKRHLNRISLISVREQASYNDLIRVYNRPDKIVITPDVIFATSFDKQKIGYGDSVRKEIRKRLRKQKNYFPMSYIEQGCYHDIESLNIPSLHSYISWLKGLELYVTGRFHGVCLSAMANTPFLAFKSNSHKIQGILKDMNCEELIITSLDEVEKKKELAIKALPKIAKYTKKARGQIIDLFKRIGKL